MPTIHRDLKFLTGMDYIPFGNSEDREAASATNKNIKFQTDRANAAAENGDRRIAQLSLEAINDIDPRMMPAANVEALFQGVEERRMWATRKAIGQMGIRHIDGRDE